MEDGSIRAVQKAKPLVRREGAYRSKSSAQGLADEFLKPFNNGSYTADSTTPLGEFIEKPIYRMWSR